MNKSLRLTESAVMLALGFVLSLVKVIDMPFGGSVTALSMLPVIIIAYRYKTVWGLFVGFTASLLQMLMGMKNLTYGTSAGAVIAIIMLDYVLAFTVMGLGGIFRGKIKDQGVALAAGALIACVLRFICHVISGCTVWAGVSIPDTDGLLYSLAYNCTYMIPETLLTVVGAYFAGKVLTLTEQQVKRVPAEGNGIRNVIISIPTVLGIVVAFAIICGMMQAEEGGFDITALTQTDIYDWIGVIVIVAVGILASVAIKAFAFKDKSKAQ